MNIESLKEEFKITDKMAMERSLGPGGEKTALKELIGEKAIKKYNVWEKFFPGYSSVKRVTTKKLQLAGVDFIINEDTFIDLKADIGPDYGCIVPVEIRQNGIFTMLSTKKTDWILHIIIDDYQRKAVLIDYQWLSKLAHKIAVSQANHTGIPFELYTSWNNTGTYIKLDYTKLPPESRCSIIDLEEDK